MRLDLQFPGWVQREAEDGLSVHIWPEDRIEHMASEHCACDPLLEFTDAESEKEVWVHFHDRAPK